MLFNKHWGINGDGGAVEINRFLDSLRPLGASFARNDIL
jgi:hypothetical protein